MHGGGGLGKMEGGRVTGDGRCLYACIQLMIEHHYSITLHLDSIAADCIHDDLFQVGGGGKGSHLCQPRQLNTLVHLGHLEQLVQVYMYIQYSSQVR